MAPPIKPKASGPTVRAVSNDELKERVGERKKLLEKQLKGDALNKALGRLDNFARTGVAAFDPVTGDVLVAVERVKGTRVKDVLQHEFAHRRFYALTPKEREAVIAAFTKSPVWKGLLALIVSDDPTIDGASNDELVSEVLSQAITAPNGQIARLAASILQSKALAPLREAADRPFSVDWGGELELQPWNELDGPDASANWSRLNDTQKKALRTAEASAKKESQAKRAQLVARAKKLGFTEAELDTVLEHVKSSAQITINFQPDKQTTAGKPLIDAFLADGRYVNQFESKITSGSFGPTPGSSRDGWEKTIFRGDYHAHPLDPKERPKYGSLNAEEGAAGGATNYGNSFLVLRDGVKNRLTLTPSDSSGANAGQVGTAEHIGNVLGDGSVPDQKFQAIMNRALGRPVPAGSTAYGYIEVQVHGPVDFKTDVARVVANSMYRGNADYERKLREFAGQLGVGLDWTNGTSIFDDDNVPVNYAWAAIGGSAGIANVSAPSAPPKFTPVRYGDSVAFVPSESGATAPDKMPRGYVAVTHAAAGTVLVPDRFVKDGKLADTAWFGASPIGAAAPLVALGVTYAITAAGGYGTAAIDGPAAPAGYTVVSASLGSVSGIAFAPIAASTAAPTEVPSGFVAIAHPRAGTVLVPKNLTDGGKPSGGIVFGANAATLPAPAVSLAPPAPVSYGFTSPYGPAHGTTAISAPPAPPEYTAVRYGGGVAFVPTRLGAPLPDELPSGYVTQKHALLGTIYVPAAASGSGTAVTLGITATGLPAPAVPIARSYKFSSYGYPFEAAEPPAGYTAVRLGPSSVAVAFMPTAGTTPVPDTPPEGYVAMKDDEAGTLFLPVALAPGGVLAAGWEFGETADGMPNPVMSLAPPPPVSVAIPAMPGGGHYGGGRTLTVPAPPPDYTIVGFMGSVAYVPAKAGAKAPKRPPTNFVEFMHPKAGRIFLPNGYAAVGPGTFFGKTATGYPEPAVKIETPTYTFPGGSVLPGEEPPPGYTVLLFAGSAVAYAPATATAKAPKEPPPGYIAIEDDEAGTLLVPEAYAPSGTITPGYDFGVTATGLPEPRVALAPPPPVTVTIPAMPGLAGYVGRGGTYSVPPPPADYTVVGFSGGGIAYVPAKTSAKVPKRPPTGYAEITHPRAGKVFVAAGYAGAGVVTAGMFFGKTAAGFPEPVVPVEPTIFTFASGATIPGEAPPDGYTALLFAGRLIAYAPSTAGAKAPKVLPPGYVAHEDVEAGTLLVPEAYASYAAGGYDFGPTAAGLPEPRVVLAPPAPVSVTLPSTTLAPGGTFTLPPPPAGYTLVACTSGGVAYVPVKRDAPAPKRPPAGYVEVTHPRSGKLLMAAGYVSGALPAGVVFGKTATGYAEPEVPIETAVFSFSTGHTLGGEAPPAGYTAVLYGGNVLAYVSAVAGATAPADLPPGYVAVADATRGTFLIPEGYAPGGVRLAGYLFGPTATGQPAPAVAVEGT